MTDDVTDRAIASIVTQFRGGEHTLAGRRAAELINGSGKKAGTEFQDRLIAAAPGIERHIVSPDGEAPPAEDQSGNPMTTDPQNKPDATGATNISTDEARAEQDEVDERLKKGRARLKKAATEAEIASDVSETKMNPDASETGSSGSPASTNAVSKSSGE